MRLYTELLFVIIPTSLPKFFVVLLHHVILLTFLLLFCQFRAEYKHFILIQSMHTLVLQFEAYSTYANEHMIQFSTRNSIREFIGGSNFVQVRINFGLFQLSTIPGMKPLSTSYWE